MNPEDEVDACVREIREVLFKFNCDISVSEDGDVIVTSDEDEEACRSL
jgi:SepF-like predicted cell division protein (DUF552 family)